MINVNVIWFSQVEAIDRNLDMHIINRQWMSVYYGTEAKISSHIRPVQTNVFNKLVFGDYNG